MRHFFIILYVRDRTSFEYPPALNFQQITVSNYKL